MEQAPSAGTGSCASALRAVEQNHTAKSLFGTGPPLLSSCGPTAATSAATASGRSAGANENTLFLEQGLLDQQPPLLRVIATTLCCLAGSLLPLCLRQLERLASLLQPCQRCLVPSTV